MMRNNRDGTFRDVTAETGLDRNNTRYSFCCGWSDYNRDGWPDLYVVNDFGRKNLYRNNGDGTFTDVAAQAGVEDIGAGWVSAGWTTTMMARTIYTLPICGRPPANASPRRHISETGAVNKSKHSIANTQWATPCSETAGNGTFKDRGASVKPQWADGPGRAMPRDFDHDGHPDLYIVQRHAFGRRARRSE